MYLIPVGKVETWAAKEGVISFHESRRGAGMSVGDHDPVRGTKMKGESTEKQGRDGTIL